ncbi:hypothetical protein ACFQU7_24010 [Pseudoroseomonas wenyumeiae]
MGRRPGFDIQANELGTAPQFLNLLSCHGFTHGVLINPLGATARTTPTCWKPSRPAAAG